MYATADNSSIAVIQHETRVNQADFLGTEGQIITVCEDKALRLFNAKGEMVSESCSRWCMSADVEDGGGWVVPFSNTAV